MHSYLTRIVQTFTSAAAVRVVFDTEFTGFLMSALHHDARRWVGQALAGVAAIRILLIAVLTGEQTLRLTQTPGLGRV